MGLSQHERPLTPGTRYTYEVACKLMNYFTERQLAERSFAGIASAEQVLLQLWESFEGLREENIVGVIGFEPTTSCSQSKRSSQAELHPEKSANDSCPNEPSPVPGLRPGRDPRFGLHSLRSCAESGLSYTPRNPQTILAQMSQVPFQDCVLDGILDSAYTRSARVPNRD